MISIIVSIFVLLILIVAVLAMLYLNGNLIDDTNYRDELQDDDKINIGGKND